MSHLTGDITSPRGPRAIRVARVYEHSFLASPIIRGSTVVDLGMNVGGFAKAMISAFGCRVVGVEPSPALFESIPSLPELTAEQLAVTGDGLPVTLFLNHTPLAATTYQGLVAPDSATIEVAGVTLEKLLDRHEVERTPLIKVDIEGAELAMLNTASEDTLRRADQLTVEFHDFLDQDQAPSVRAVKERLRSAGFAQLAFSSDNTDVLFVNTARIRFGIAQLAGSALAYKYPRGIARNLERRVLTRRAQAGRWLSARRAGAR